MTARTAWVTLTTLCIALTIVRGRVDGVTVLAVVFAFLAVMSRPKPKVAKK